MFFATFADDTAVPTTQEDRAIATHRLQTNLNKIHLWLNKWRMKVNEIKLGQVTFTLKNNTCPPVQLNNKQLTEPEEVKYLGRHPDRKLTCLPDVHTYLHRENNWISAYANCNESLAENRNCHWKINY
jgi:hypothetical protein